MPSRKLRAQPAGVARGASKRPRAARNDDASTGLSPRQRADTAGLTRAQLLELYRALYETRELDHTLIRLYRQGQIPSGVYSSLGQEATAVGCAYAMRRGDFVQPLIRDLGAMLVHGVSPLGVLRQAMGKATGPSGGREPTTFFTSVAHGILGPVAMLGAMFPVVAGCLLAARAKGEARAALAFIGDGGSSTGSFYEGLNFAAVQRLPLIAVLEANGYAYSTPTSAQVLRGDLLPRARAFGCPVQEVDGNDVLACYEATRHARAEAMDGAGPTVIVAHTYRRAGHAAHDNQAYVPEGELDAWAAHNDPLARYRTFLRQHARLAATDLDACEHTVRAELEAAQQQAAADPTPNPGTVALGVYDDGSSPWPNPSTWFRGAPPHREDAP